MVLTLSVDTLLAFARVFLLQFPMAYGLTSPIMMHPPNLSSLARETLGTNITCATNFLYASSVEEFSIILCHICQICRCRYDDSKGDPLPHVRYESGIQPWIDWPGNVLWTYGWWSAHWALRWHVGRLVCKGIMHLIILYLRIVVSCSFIHPPAIFSYALQIGADFSINSLTPLL